jgi:peroxiredoxin
MDHKVITASRLKRVFLIVSMALVTVSLSDYRGEQPVLLYFHMALG